jgi:hypothetical protein
MIAFTSQYVPSYVSWLKNDTEYKTDAAMKYLKRFLEEHLRSDKDDRPWILKTPWHLAQLDSVLKEYSKSRFVWLHRDPVESLTSMVELSRALISAASDVVKDRERFAQYVTDVWFWSLERGVESRNKLAETSPNTEFLDISFHGLNADPVEMATRVFKKFGYKIDKTQQARMKRFALANEKGKRAADRSLKKKNSDLGFDPEVIRARYSSIMRKLKQTNFIDLDKPKAGPTWDE